MPLTMVNIGEVNYIKKITGKDEVRQHLAELGFVIGEEIKLISIIGGNVIASIKNSRVALNKSMANRIIV